MGKLVERPNRLILRLAQRCDPRSGPGQPRGIEHHCFVNGQGLAGNMALGSDTKGDPSVGDGRPHMFEVQDLLLET